MVEFAELSIQKIVPIAKKRQLKYILQCFTIPTTCFPTKVEISETCFARRTVFEVTSESNWDSRLKLTRCNQNLLPGTHFLKLSGVTKIQVLRWIFSSLTALLGICILKTFANLKSGHKFLQYHLTPLLALYIYLYILPPSTPTYLALRSSQLTFSVQK